MTIKLGLVGTGTVGGGCLDILRNHREDFKRHLGVDMEVVRVCSRNPEQAEARGVLHLFTEDFNDIINDPEIDIVIELIGGTTAARDVVLLRTWSLPTGASHGDVRRRSVARRTWKWASRPASAAASPSSSR